MLPVHALFAKNGEFYDLTRYEDIKALRLSEPEGRFSKDALIRERGNQLPPRKRQNIEEPVDPFEDQGTPDEAQTELPPPWETGTVDTETNENKEVRVVNVSEGKLVVTLKGGKGYEAPWVVVHAIDVDDAMETLSHEKLPALLEKAQKASEYFEGAAPTKDTGQVASRPQNGSQGQQQRTQGRPAAATEGPWGVQTCEHGTMTFKSGVGDDGNVWQGYFCPVPKGQFPRCAKNKYVK